MEIEAMKSEDAQPIVKAKWIEDSDGDGFCCSNCGADFCTFFYKPDCFDLYEKENFKYCPVCGARIEIGDDTENGTDN